MKKEFLDASADFTAWCKTALRFWAENGCDPRGGVYEHLFMDGTPDADHLRRVRVQARYVYVYAHAAHLGWYEDSKTACDHAWSFLTGPGFAGGDYIAGDGPRGCAHLVTGIGAMHDDMRDTYAQAFVLLSGAWRYKAFNDDAALKIAEDTLAFLNTHLKAENGGWYEGLPKPVSSQRRQNPHMHLFEAFLALNELTGQAKYLEMAGAMFDLFEAHFFDPKRKALLEFFNPDWSPENGDGGPTEPGHMMEWCWLLRVYERLSGRNMDAYANALFEGGMEYGLNPKLGLLCDAVELDGSPSKPTLRSWPQTELIKASVAQAAAGQLEYLGDAAKGIRALMRYYLDVPVKGGWADKLNPEGEIISQVMPTSTFYHLFCAAVEADALAKSLKAA